MCLAIPARVIELRDEGMALVAVEGMRQPVSLALLDEVSIGDYVLIHVGYALHRISETEAQRTLELMHEAGLTGSDAGAWP